MIDFFNWFDKTHYTHLLTVGNKYTLSNGQKGRHLTEKILDRVVCNVDRLNVCSIVICNTLAKMNSGHYPIFLSCDFDEFEFIVPIQFLKMWSLNEECTNIIKKSWMTGVSGCPMHILDKKLRILKPNLNFLNKTKFGNVKTKVIEVEKTLMEIQSEIDSLVIKKAQTDIEISLNLEEEF